MTGPIVQSAVNVSEGRRPDAIAAIVEAAASAPGALVADWSADPDHNRMVVTLLCPPGGVRTGVRALAAAALDAIDLREHTGAHPRIGAVDVVPVTPIRGVTMDECVALAALIGHDLASEFDVPVYFYERSASPGRRTALPEIRKGGFEGLVGALEGDRAPDLGPRQAHATGGAVVVGARDPLVAYNVELAEPDVAAARRIAAAIRRLRATEPALEGVRSLGLWLPTRGVAQVSMNLTRPARTPLPGVFDVVREEARRQSANVQASEVIGLIPRASLGGEPPARICWHDPRDTQIIEWWLERDAALRPPGTTLNSPLCTSGS